MAIQDDFTIDYVDDKITYTNGFTSGIANTRYTVNELYSFLQDTFDEPAQMDNTIPMSAQTPTQYTLINKWFMDDETMKALYSGSIQTANWTKSGSEGITSILWDGGGDVPDQANIGTEITGSSSSATGNILAVDEARQVVFVRNTNANQFLDADTCTGTSVSFTVATSTGAQQDVRSGDSIWTNLFSVGTIQADTEIYVAQEDEEHGGSTVPKLEALTSWWDSDTDFTASLNGVAAGHFDVLVKVQDGGIFLDDLNLTSQGRLRVYSRQGDTIYSHFILNAAVGNNVVPFAATGFDGNQRGFARVDIPGTFTGAFVVGEIITAPGGAKARLTAFVTDTSLSYVLVGKDLTEFTTAAELITGEDSGASATKDTNAPTAINGAVSGGITITDGHNGTFDVDQDGNTEDYAMVVNCNNVDLSVVYERLQFLTRRGETTAILPEPGAGNEEGQFYRGVGEVYITTDAEGTGLTEGETVSGSLSSATGEVVAYGTGGAPSYLIVTNVKGAFVNNDVITDEGAGSVTADADQISLVDVNAAPFGTFAGGRFFVARGVVLDNVPAADNNNWETSDVTGTVFSPPATIALTFAGLVADDRAIVLEVATPGGTDVVKTTVGLASGAIGSSLIVLDSNVAQDVPSAGWIRVVDTSVAGKEERYEFSSITTTSVTLRTVSPGDDVANVGGSNTVLSDINVGLNFGTNGNAKVGHQIRNVSDSSEAVILRRINDNSIETTPLTGGGLNVWTLADGYEINTVAFLIDAADTAYFPFLDDTVESGTSLSESLSFDSTTEILARMRFSDPDVGGNRILPFEQLNLQITNADLTITAIRTDDPIVT